MKKRILKISVAGLLIIYHSNHAVIAQDVDEFDFQRIEDNSFLLEEAYNQESGIIQHISTFQYMNDKSWSYSFTEEWPCPGQKSQVSVTVPFCSWGNPGLCDVALNYRYQAVFTSRIAFSPRISLLFPSGDYKKGFGNGAMGYQVNLPLSTVLTKRIVTHFNLGATYTSGAKAPDESKSNLTTYNYGASAIWLVTQNFNFMFEIIGYSSFNKPDNFASHISNTFFLNPGFRYAINCKSGLQIVPGMAVPIGIGESAGEYGIFGYLSFEHPLWK